MLFEAKLDAIRRHLAYTRRTLESCSVGAHPNLAARLRLSLALVGKLELQTTALATQYSGYRTATRPALDIWRQLVAQLRIVDGTLQILRTLQLPAYLATAAHDRTFSMVFQNLCREAGVTDVNPVVSLHQPGWFAVFADFTSHPLFLAPDSLLSDPGELPLVFHEMGHVLFQLWSPALPQRLLNVVRDTIRRKAGQIQTMSDPTDRQAFAAALNEWQSLAVVQLEELFCDIVGTLLGGPAFTVALTVGLLTTDTAPFTYSGGSYPPLDCRMRVGGIVLRRLGIEDQTLDAAEAGWASVRAAYSSSQTRFYTWLYDDAYVDDLATDVEAFFTSQGMQLYRPGCGGARERLAEGAALRLADPVAYGVWARDTADFLLQTYSS